MSNKGELTVKVRACHLTLMQLRVIQAELTSPKKRFDFISVIISLLTAGIAILQLFTLKFDKNELWFCLLLAFAGLFFIQAYRIIDACLRKAEKSHEKNVEDILKTLENSLSDEEGAENVN